MTWRSAIHECYDLYKVRLISSDFLLKYLDTQIRKNNELKSKDVQVWTGVFRNGTKWLNQDSLETSIMDELGWFSQAKKMKTVLLGYHWQMAQRDSKQKIVLFL